VSFENGSLYLNSMGKVIGSESMVPVIAIPAFSPQVKNTRHGGEHRHDQDLNR